MRVIVTGSRDWGDGKAVYEALNMLLGDSDAPFTVVHGECETGADSYASAWVRGTQGNRPNVTEEGHPADWKLGQVAGFWRNTHMANLGADLCVAFLNRCRKNNCSRGPRVHGTHGTAHMIGEAKKNEIETWVYPSYEEN